MYIRNPVGFIISCIGSLFGTVVTLFIFVGSYTLQVDTELARGAPTEALLVTYVLPALANLAFVGGILWSVSAYGFFFGKEYAFVLALIASVVSILAGFFPILPYVSSGLGFPPTAVIFALNLLFFVMLQRYVQVIDGYEVGLSLLMGVSYVLAFVNGIASTHYLLSGGGEYYSLLEPLNFGASIAWGIATLAYVVRKNWARPLIIGAALTSVFAGIPIALINQAELSRPSLFWPSPIVAAAVLVLYAKYSSEH